MARYKINLKTKCWEWQGGTREGYGVLGGGKRNHLLCAHRVSYMLMVGAIPKGKCVLHHCDNRRCFNPRHLFFGTRKDNSVDRDVKGRTTKGEQHYRAKLNPKDIKQIRLMVAQEGWKHRQVASYFGVSRACISQIIRKTNWKHV